MTKSADATTVSDEIVPDPKDTTGPVFEDPDDILLKQLQEEEEKAAKPAEGEPAKPETVQDPAAAKPAEAKPEGKDEHQPLIPKSRLDQEIAKRRQAETEAAYSRGIAEGLLAGARRGPASPKPEPVVDHAAEIEAQRAALAEQYDNNEISMKEFVQKDGALVREIIALATEPLRKQPPRTETPSGDSLIVDERTADLEKAHPYAMLIPADTPEGKVRWAHIENEAAVALEREGMVFHPGPGGALPAREQLALRTRMAELTDIYGPVWVGKIEQVSQAHGQPSRVAEARGKKLDLAESHPLDVSNLGNAASTTDVEAVTARLSSMTEDEIMALPDGIRRQIMKDQ